MRAVFRNSILVAVRGFVLVTALLPFGAAGVAETASPDGVRRLWPIDQWRTSPFHRAQDADGRTIPCVCVFKGRNYRVGEIVCMSTHVGVVLTRCDMNLNITSWVPSDSPCDVSQLAPPVTVAQRIVD